MNAADYLEKGWDDPEEEICAKCGHARSEHERRTMIPGRGKCLMCGDCKKFLGEG